jgi:protein TonB
MERAAILQADYLDIIFNHRNKAYGGYELRKHYSQRATKATFITLATLVLLITAHAIAGRFEHETVIATPVLTSTKLTDLTATPIPPKVEQPKPAAAPVPAKTIVWTPPKIEKDNVVTNPPKTIDDLKTALPGTANVNGDPTSLVPGVETHGTGNSLVTNPVEPPKVFQVVEQMPEFNGDLKSYLSTNIRYPELAKENNVEGRVFIRFVVNEDGAISGAEVLRGIGGGCDDEALRVLKTMPKWKPGKQNGRAVKVFFTLPIVFKLT